MADYTPSIRKALEVKLNSVTGIPTIAWENIKFTPTTGTSFVRPYFLPVSRRPASRGLNPYQLYTGVFSVNVYCASGNGPNSADDFSALIIDDFEATTDILFNIDTSAIVNSSAYESLDEEDRISVTIDYAERQQGMVTENDWYMVPVDIGWYTYKK